MPTIKDVARLAGVSVATVSRMMNRPEVVKPQTTAKIKKAMKELDYYPDAMARALQTRRSGIVGLIVPSISYDLFARIAAAAEDSLSGRGYRLMICHSEYEERREMDMVSMLKSNKVDGILVCSYAGDSGKYSTLNLPIVSMDREMERIPSVTCDNAAGGELAARELMEAGCGHPLIIGYPVPVFMPLHARLDSFRKCFADAGKECGWLELDSFGQDTVTKLETYLKLHPETDGMFVNSDHMAANLTRFARAAGSDIMDRMPVVSFDGLEASDLMDITTVAQPIEDMGRCAVDILLSRVEGRKVPIRSTLDVKLIRRGSTAGRGAGKRQEEAEK